MGRKQANKEMTRVMIVQAFRDFPERLWTKQNVVDMLERKVPLQCRTTKVGGMLAILVTQKRIIRVRTGLYKLV